MDDNLVDMAGLGETPPVVEIADPAPGQAESAEPLVDVETLGKDLPAWKLAGLMRHQRWAPGKAVSETEFRAALATFEGRPLGGGR